MNQKFINACMKNLVIQRDFMPVRDEAGNLQTGGPVNLLAKSAYGNFAMVELLDADRLSAAELEARLMASENMLLEMNFGSSQQFYVVAFFESEPDREMLDVITSYQSHVIKGRKLLKCMTVQLSSKAVVKYFKTPWSDSGLEKTIRLTMGQDLSREAEDLDLEGIVRQKEQEYRIPNAVKTPILTYAFIALNILVFLLLNLYAMSSGKDAGQLLHDIGAKDNGLIMSGEWWRLIVPVVFHNGPVHLAVNCYSLYVVGVMVEKIFGHYKFLIVYLFAGLLGNIASFMFSTHWSVGASGAIFGLMGTLLYFGLERPALFRAYFGYSVIATIMVNLVYGFSNAGIDNFAHMGGLAGGFLATGAISVSGQPKWYLNRSLYLILAVAVAGGGLWYGLTNRQNTLLRRVNEVEQLDREQKWSEVEKTAEEVLAKGPDRNSRITVLWLLARAEALSGKYEEGVVHAKELSELSPENGYYLLGLMYYDLGEYQSAREALLEAKKVNAGFKNIDELLAEIDKILK